MKFKAIVVDDEELARALLKEFIERTTQVELLGTFKNPQDAMAFLAENEVDIMFLDIQMPGMTGIEMLRKMDKHPEVVLTTAYSEYALEGYELDVVDYLVKPFAYERFIQSVDRATNLVSLKNRGRDNRNYVSLHADHKIYRLKLDDIHYIEGLKEYVSYYTDKKRIIVLQSLKSIEQNLPPDKFMRVHKSYIVSIDKVEALNGNQVEIGGKTIPIGRSYRDEVLEKIF